MPSAATIAAAIREVMTLTRSPGRSPHGGD